MIDDWMINRKLYWNFLTAGTDFDFNRFKHTITTQHLKQQKEQGLVVIANNKTKENEKRKKKSFFEWLFSSRSTDEGSHCISLAFSGSHKLHQDVIVLLQNEPIDQNIYSELKQSNKIVVRISPEDLQEHNYFVAQPAMLAYQQQESRYVDAIEISSRCNLLNDEE